MDIRKIKKLIELIEGSQLAELEIKEGEESIRLSRLSAHATVASVPIAAPVAEPPGVRATIPDAVESERENLPAGNAVKSPMVGTFYSSSSPSIKAFAELGQQVNAGEVICIIEAMKIFNQIKSEFAGTVKAITKQDGDPVEFGEILFIVE